MLNYKSQTGLQRASQALTFAKVLAAFLLAILFAVPASVSAASPRFYFDTLLTYTVKNQDLTNVNYRVTVTNQTSNYYTSGYTLVTSEKNVENLKVRYVDGTKIPSTVEKIKRQTGDVNIEVNKITMKFPRQITGSNARWAFTVSFDTNSFVIKRGQTASIVYIPGVQFGPEDRNFQAQVVAPTSFGEAHFSGVKPTSASAPIGGKQIITYGKKQLINSGISISFGDAAYYRFQMSYPLKNPIPWWKTVWITLPPTLPTQDVYLSKLSERPTSMKLDADGNVLAGYRLAPLGKRSITADLVVKVKFLDYDLSISGKRSDIPREIVDAYTKPDKYWESQSEQVKKLADSAYDDSKTVAVNVQAIYKATIKTLTYNASKLDFNTRLGAADAITQPKNAVCMEFADVMIAMLRSKGIPARNPVGYAYGEGLKPSDSVADSLHSWVEAYIPNVGWVQVDPTWGEKVDNFSKSDFDHVAFAVFGLKSDQPSATFVGGVDLGYQYEQSKVSFTEKTEAKPQAVIHASNIPLPLFNLTQLSIENTGNAVLYSQQLSAEGVDVYPKNEIGFGDSAPFQKDPYYLLSFASSPKAYQLKLSLAGATAGTIPELLASKSVPINPLINWLEAAALLAIIVLVIAHKIKRRNKKAGHNG